MSDSDFPNNFKELVSNYINISIEGLYNQQIKKEYKEDFLLFLTYLSNGMNMPSAITKLLVKLSNSIQNNSSFQRHLSFAVGDVRLDWQKEIFNNILKSINENSKIVLNILSRVFWRSSSLIFKLDEKQANEVLKSLYENIRENNNSLFGLSKSRSFLIFSLYSGTSFFNSDVFSS